MSVFNKSRSYIIRIIFLSVFIIIIAQLANLQLVSNKYLELAKNNAVFEKIIYPERGIIFDRNGKAVLNNTIMFDLMVTPAEVKNFDTTAFCSLMQIDTAEFRARIITAIIKNSRVRPSIFHSLLTPEMQARFEENSWRFPGFVLQQRPVRTYPYNVGAHILGYISEVDAKDIERSGNFYRMGDYVGKNGLEYTYEKVLMGQRGVQYMIKDNRNRLVGHYENGEFDTTAVAGRGLKTHLDVELQVLAEKLLKDKVGSVVALDPRTGGILAMASGPVFNPNDLTGPDKNANYAKLLLNVRAPLLNRGIKGRYPPGSTFKPLGGLVALDEGVITPSYGYPCGGGYYACGRRVGCTHAGGGHAANLRLAIANSCNSYFVQVYRMAVDNPRAGSMRKGFEDWMDYMHKFGLGVRLGVDLPSEDKGNIPSVATYDKEYRGSWTSCTNLTLGIGQDKMLATPLQLANAMSIIANKGYYYIPHFVDSIDGETAADARILAKYREKHAVLTHISDTAYNAIINGMNDVVTRGTARVAMIPGINVCAKTGTAENYTILDRKRIKLKDNSMFVCFAPKENPKIAIAVAVENAGYGATWAGPIARILMEKYLLDSLTNKSKADFERISNTNLMPAYYNRLQYITDSARAEQWAKIRRDSTQLLRYLKKGAAPKAIPKKDSAQARDRKPQDQKPKQKKPSALVALFTDDRKYYRPVTASGEII
ncbi:penicillin-binding protein 2 [Niabella aurantiaca]|uniref:penicillin-binding protein 2 n=1 Tax=Niabella aurantiaca TaxID=379900 RepID=UPI00035DB774|nr:penicillin-binding protein 2 [Niabella aurantiaca]